MRPNHPVLAQPDAQRAAPSTGRELATTGRVGRRGTGQKLLAYAAICLALWAPGAALAGPSVEAKPRGTPRIDRLRLTALRVDGREPELLRPLAAWAAEVRLRTSVETERDAQLLDLRNDGIFASPLLIWAPSPSPQRPAEVEVARLREHLGSGGMLLIDDTGASGPSADIDAAVRALAMRLFGRTLVEVPATDVVYRSFYRLAAPVGRRADHRALQGVRLGDRWAVLYSRDDLIGAFRRAPTGGPALPAAPGGEPQREQAYRLAVNLLVYATCLDYKDDHVHVESLLRQRRGGPRAGARRGD